MTKLKSYYFLISGCPYVLPVVFNGDSWTVNKRLEEDTHLKQELKRINKIVKSVHSKVGL